MSTVSRVLRTPSVSEGPKEQGAPLPPRKGPPAAPPILLQALAVALALGSLPGCPGRTELTPADAAIDAPPDAPPPPEVKLRISEILYHPVGEDAFDDRHELVEITNAGAAPVALAGWRLSAETVAFDFPADAVIGPGEYLVIAKDAARVAQVWGLAPATVLGDFAGNLDNGDDTVRLVEPSGVTHEKVTYRDELPWPIAADAMGAGEKWLPAAVLPLTAHQYRGYSLERVNLDLPADDVTNWVPSPLDGASPGRGNAGAAAVPPPIALAVGHVGGEVQVELSAHPGLTAVELEWFVDDLKITGEPTTRVAMTDAGARHYTVTLPAFPDHTIVRYRIRADVGAGLGVISPRATDPYAWHALAQVPTIATATPVYQLYIAPAAWGAMWTSLTGGRDSGCTVNAHWNDEVPAVLVTGGEVYDVWARYQGSRYNRTNGPALPAWPYPAPTAGPNPPRVLSWHLALPRYHKLAGRSTIVLNKNRQGCPGYDAAVGFALFRAAGVPAPETNFAQLRINGGYYHYMLEIERPGDEMMSKSGPVGRLYKAIGQNGDGAYGWADERQLGPLCGLTSTQRYELTYDEKTHPWATHDDLIALLDGLATARAAGVPALRAFFADNFDLPLLLDEQAIMNWAVPFDDMFQNHFLYHRRDGKWIVMPWDLDLNFGGWKGATASLWIGEQGDPDNRSGWWNYLKDGFIKAYRPELGARMRELANSGILAPTAVATMVDAVTASANPAEAAMSPVGLGCTFPARATSFKQFAVDRQTAINARIAP